MQEMTAIRPHKDYKTKKKQDYAERETLVLKAIQGDNEAISELVRSTTRLVLFYTSKMLRSRMDAEDASQEIMLRVCTNIGGLKNPKKFDSWLNTIIVNETRRYMVKNYSHSSDSDISELDDIEDMDENSLPQNRVEHDEFQKTIMDIINTLPDRQKEAVLLRYYHDLNVKETAAAMGIRHQSASENIKIALEKIEKSLKTNLKDELSYARGISIFPLAVWIKHALLEDANAIITQNSAWVANIAEQYAPLVLGGNAGAAGAASAAAQAAGAAAQTAGGVGISLGPALTIAAAAVVVAATAIGISMSTPKETAPPAHTPTLVQTMIYTDGGIVFTGGTKEEHVNPVGANVWASNELGDLTALEWWITPKGSEEILLVGEGGTVDSIYARMLERGSEGRFILNFLMKDPEDNEYILDREFAIEFS